ncbi:hypothetical protein DY218_31290 [Streptomyces triticagri]|uniref:ABC transporter permease n=1 Tax=Streptomyces triticagri TaxID=2293568 RepID=A0A372LVR4_9ACTN|nr:hypothetical protein [Streptomyces triticagri]RFU82744.1 hypothetical protein DY218_31290 [Streptomyces triticagri]
MKGLLQHLLRIGVTSARRGEAGRIRFWSLALATALLGLAATGLVLAQASFDGRVERSAERSPRLVAAHPGEKAGALVKWSIASHEGMPYDITHVEPLDEELAPPPGLPRWPEPGEAFVSPALLEAAGRDGVGREYGYFAGVIGDEGLESPSEYFVYARPSTQMLDRSEMMKISGFGEPGTAGIAGEHAHFFGSGEFYSVYAGLFVLPAVVLLVVAARTGAVSRDRRTALLTALGAGAVARCCFTVGEAAVPVLIGVGVSALAASPVLMGDFALPGVSSTVSAVDARESLSLLVLVHVVLLLGTVVAVVLLQPKARAARSTRPTTVRARRRTWPLWVFLPALLFTARIADLAPPELTVPLYAAGCLVTLAALPAIVGMAVGALGPLLARIGRRLGNPGLLVSGRRMAAGPRAVTRLIAALVIAIALAVQAQVWAGAMTEAGQAAKDSRDRVGTSVLRIQPYASKERLRAFEEALPSGVHALAAAVSAKDGARVAVAGRCPALREVGLSCGTREAPASRVSADRRLREAFGYSGKLAVTAERGGLGRLPEESGNLRSLLVVGTDGAQLSMTEVSRIAHRELDMAATVQQVNNYGSVGRLDIAVDWLRLMSLLGVGVIALAAGTGALAEFLRFGRDLAPVTVLSAGQGVFRAAAVWSLLLPAVLASFAGVLVSWWLSASVRSVAETDPWSMAPTTVGALVCSGGLAVWGMVTAVREAERWRPSGA